VPAPRCIEVTRMRNVLRETRGAWIGTSGADRRYPIQVAEASFKRPAARGQPIRGGPGHRVRRGGTMVTCLAKVQS